MSEKNLGRGSEGNANFSTELPEYDSLSGKCENGGPPTLIDVKQTAAMVYMEFLHPARFTSAC